VVDSTKEQFKHVKNILSKSKMTFFESWLDRKEFAKISNEKLSLAAHRAKG